MELEKFKDANRNELSMIEVAHAILNEHGKEMVFADLVNEIQTFLGKSDQEIRDRLPQFYMDLNFDGSFISLGENTWGLRSWYPYESIDEALVHTDDEDRPRKKSKKVNVFLDDAADDDDVIDYNDDDPEDNDLDDDYDDEDDEDENRELKEYSRDLDDIDDADDTEDDLPDGIEGQLNELDDDEDSDDDDEL